MRWKWIPLVWSITGCGNAAGDAVKPTPDAAAPLGNQDASAPSAQADASGAYSGGLGQACDPSVASSCSGEYSTCLTALTVLNNQVTFEGGYCTKSCEQSADCGSAGACPIGETRSQLAGSPAQALFANLPSHCLERCEHASDCRTTEGYACGPLTSAMPESLRPIAENVLSGKPIAEERFCVPAKQLADAGT